MPAEKVHLIDFCAKKPADETLRSRPGQGYVIGSGTVESDGEQIVTHRLKRAGARWSEQGAHLKAKARAAYLSGQWDQLARRRSELPLAV